MIRADALALAQLGPIIPLHSIREGRCSCREAGCRSPAKHPAIPRGIDNATSDPARIAAIDWTQRNIGLCTGDGLFAIDVDAKHRAWIDTSSSPWRLIDGAARVVGELLPSRLHRTGGGGWHYICRAPAELGNSAGRLGLGIDTRGARGYVVAPPSIHASGNLYEVVADLPLAELPARIVERLRQARRYSESALARSCEVVQGAPEGSRNDTLNRAAFAAGCWADLLDPNEVAASLARAGIIAGLDRREALDTACRGLAAGMQQPRAVFDDWPDPLPFELDEEGEPYPLTALPRLIRGAVEEVQEFVQAPAALVASCALGVQSLAVQHLADVERDEGLRGPCSLYLLTLGDSGERKSAVDRLLIGVIREHERDSVAAAAPARRSYCADLETWKAERDGLKDAIRRVMTKIPAAGATAVDDLKARMRSHELASPRPPMVPEMILGDMTTPGLGKSLTTRWPSAGLVSAEAGLIFGGHAMGKDSIMGYVSTLNSLWDASPHLVGRADRDREVRLDGRQRFSLSLMVQPSVFSRFLRESGALARGSGLLARLLISRPTSTQGIRIYKPAPPAWPRLNEWSARLRSLLALPTLENGHLDPKVLRLSDPARCDWIRFHNTIEAELRPDGECSSVRDVASKTAEQAARIAAVLHFVEHGLTDVCADCFAAGVQVAAWHLDEARRYLGMSEAASPDADARMLESWILNFCREKGGSSLSRRDCQRFGKVPLRDSRRLEPALRRLVELNRVRDRGQTILVNPAVLFAATATTATAEATI